MRRFLRGPIFWIAMAVIAVLVGSSLISGIGAPDEVDTGVATDVTPGKCRYRHPD